MKYLHLCLDHNFIEKSRLTFEHYYPNQNIFLINKERENFKIIKDKENFIGINYGKKENFENIWDMCMSENIDTIVLHGINSGQKKLIEYLIKKKQFKIYWIFWGYELYQTLAFKHNYRLIDEKFSVFKPNTYLYPCTITYKLRKLFKKAYIPDSLEFLLPYIDYFCFWNIFDYNLLNQYYDTSIKFKYFNYGGISNNMDLFKNLYPLKERKTSIIMINHQASQTGNHKTIMQRIHDIDYKNVFNKIVPISYGSQILRKKIKELGKSLFLEKFMPINDYMSVEKYYEMLSTVDVAIFGQHRQEGAGNIIHLLRNGVKVFLRNDNSLLPYYRSKGYIIFSFEDDLCSIDDLQSLSLKEKEHNRNCYLKNISYCDSFMPNFF